MQLHMEDVVLRCVREAVQAMGIANHPDFDTNTNELDTNLHEIGVDSIIVGALHSRLRRETGVSNLTGQFTSLF